MPTDLDALIDQHFPEGFGVRGRRALNPSALVTESGPLTEAHLAIAEEHEASGSNLGSGDSVYDLKAVRNTHHRLAQFLAAGMDETRAAKLCNYTPSRVSVLKASPAFRDLLDYYASTVEDEWADFITAAADLSVDLLGRLQQILDETPEKLTAREVMEAIKLTRDYSGNAPVAKSLNVNVNAGLGDRLRAARERAQARLAEG